MKSLKLSSSMLLLVGLFLIVSNILNSAPYDHDIAKSDFFDIEFDTDIPQPSIIPPLTRKDILSYDIYADFTCDVITDYICRVNIRLLTLDNLDSLLFDLYDNTVDSVLIDGSNVLFEQHEEFLSVYPIESSIASGESLFVTIHYRGEFPSDGIKHGFDDTGALVIYSLFWPSIARNFIPSVDHPLDKATSKVSIRTTSTAKVASNGVFLGTELASDDTSEIIHSWQNDYPITTYNICFSICDNYTFIEDSAITSSDIVDIRHLVPSDRIAISEESFALVPEMIAHYDSLFGAYPFDYFGMYVTPFSAGAMEHQSMVMVGEFVLAGDLHEHLIAHELSHQWWGDAVALADWRDFWLNEGMAEYCEFLHTRKFYGADSAMSYHKNVHQDAYKTYCTYEGEFSVYDPESYLSYTVYRKGACIFHMLNMELGDSIFFPMMADYFETYKHKNVTTDSLLAFVNTYSGRDMSWFFDQWVYRDDYFPEFQYWWIVNDGTLEFYTTQVQDGDFYRIKTEIEIFQGAETYRESIEIDSEHSMNLLEGYDYADSVMFDPEGHILCEKTYAEGVSETAFIAPDDLSVETYPNPFNSGFNVEIKGSGDNYTVELVDILGNVMLRKELGSHLASESRTIYDTQSLRINALNGMPSGIYYLRVSENDSFPMIKRVLYIK